MVRAPLLLLVALPLAGCFSPSLDGVHCGAGGSCPDGYVCRGEVCEVGADRLDGGRTDAAAGHDGARADAPTVGPDARIDARIHDPGDAGDAGGLPGATVPDLVVVTSGGGGGASDRHQGVVAVGQPVAAAPVAGSGGVAAFGLLSTTEIP